MKGTALLAGVAVISIAAAAEARVTRIEIAKREPFVAGHAFGNSGPYEKIIGRFHGELEPADPLNAVIVDIDKAPRNARGRVEYSSDFYILKPADITRGNGALLYDVNNRGNKRALIQFNSAPAANDPENAAQAGNGFLMRYGFTVVWSGWIPGLPAADHALRIDVPVATASGAPIEQMVWDEFLFNNATTAQGRLTYKATSTDKSQATLFVRERNADEPAVIPAGEWEFVDAQTIRLKDSKPFRIGAIYQLVYKAANPPVSGIGFAATRDLVAFLRREAADDGGTGNPLAVDRRPAVDRALAHGTSQSGRYLRDFVYSGFNEDEAHRVVFDGIQPHVGTGRLFLNQRFAQPNRMVNIAHGFMFYPDVGFPFAYETQSDPFTGARDGILARCAERGNCPKVIHTISGTEYWQSGQSLITTDPLGKNDGTPPENVRIYHFASTQHVEIATMPKGVCDAPWNPIDRRPLLRALLLALDQWVKDGKAPPPSRYPRIADGSLVAMTATETAIPGRPPAKGPNQRPRFDYGPNFGKGIIDNVLPVELADRYGVLVPKVDADGNETAGVLLPDVAVPTGTATGWALRGRDAGGAGELCYLDGSFVPFAKTKAEREANRDPRPSLEERYRNHADYAAQVERGAAALARDGFLLPEDVQRIVAKAGAMNP
jgi:hypothetical protein